MQEAKAKDEKQKPSTTTSEADDLRKQLDAAEQTIKQLEATQRQQVARMQEHLQLHSDVIKNIIEANLQAVINLTDTNAGLRAQIDAARAPLRAAQ